MKHGRWAFGIACCATVLFGAALSGQVPNPHAGEPIGTVQQVYDGALMPDIVVSTFMASLPREAPPGTRFNYSTGETQVAAVLRGAVKRPLADYLSERVWAKFGMESDATWWLESPDGLEIGGSGLSATLRDYGRFGLFLLAGGSAGGEQILPDGWLRDASSPKTLGGQNVDYGYLLWPIPNAAATIHEGRVRSQRHLRAACVHESA